MGLNYVGLRILGLGQVLFKLRHRLGKCHCLPSSELAMNVEDMAHAPTIRQCYNTQLAKCQMAEVQFFL